MSLTFKELPGWSFEIEEVSAGVYEIVGSDGYGHRVQSKGTDPDALLHQAREDAIRLMGKKQEKSGQKEGEGQGGGGQV